MKNNPYLNSFAKIRKTIKIEEYVKSRIKMYFNEVIPQNQNSYFTIRVVNTKNNNFGFGVFDKKEQRNDKSHYSLCYNFSTGDLKDTNYIKTGTTAHWRKKIGAPIASITNAVLRIDVNMKDHRLAFYCNG